MKRKQNIGGEIVKSKILLSFVECPYGKNQTVKQRVWSASWRWVRYTTLIVKIRQFLPFVLLMAIENVEVSVHFPSAVITPHHVFRGVSFFFFDDEFSRQIWNLVQEIQTIFIVIAAIFEVVVECFILGGYFIEKGKTHTLLGVRGSVKIGGIITISIGRRLT